MTEFISNLSFYIALGLRLKLNLMQLLGLGGVFSSSKVGVLKINFAAFVTDNKAAAGYVIRNTNAMWMSAGGKLLPHISVPFAGLLAAWFGVRTAIYELHATHIWTEGDSSTAVSWINNPELQRFGHRPLLQDLIRWKGAMQFCKITYIFCEANQVAHYTARLALQGDGFYLELSIAG